jgi:hypothetical protein
VTESTWWFEALKLPGQYSLTFQIYKWEILPFLVLGTSGSEWSTVAHSNYQWTLEVESFEEAGKFSWFMYMCVGLFGVSRHFQYSATSTSIGTLDIQTSNKVSCTYNDEGQVVGLWQCWSSLEFHQSRKGGPYFSNQETSPLRIGHGENTWYLLSQDIPWDGSLLLCWWFTDGFITGDMDTQHHDQGAWGQAHLRTTTSSMG